MSYRAFAAPHGLCGAHPRTPAIGRCDGCGAPMCECCVAFELLAIRCAPCERARQIRRWRRRLGLVSIFTLLTLGLVAPIVYYIAWHYPHGAHCLNQPPDVCCSSAIFERCWDVRLYLNQSG